SDARGKLVQSYRYSPYGESYGPGDSGEAQGDELNPIRFTGQYLDSESDLYNMRAREYAPETGAFLQVDPLEADSGGSAVGVYVYVDGRPTVMTDPSGERGAMVSSVATTSTEQPSVVAGHADLPGTRMISGTAKSGCARAVRKYVFIPKDMLGLVELKTRFSCAWCWKDNRVTKVRSISFTTEAWGGSLPCGWKQLWCAFTGTAEASIVMDPGWGPRELSALGKHQVRISRSLTFETVYDTQDAEGGAALWGNKIRETIVAKLYPAARIGVSSDRKVLASHFSFVPPPPQIPGQPGDDPSRKR
ncbi:MAG: RHS repeat-associated core domain-containing protein, partial [Gaiellaceae bacterium]